MRVLFLDLLAFLFFTFLFGTWARGVSINATIMARTPPRGWNSYDSFGWVVSEEEFLANAEIVSQKLLKHGYEYVVVDYLWYRRNVEGAYRDSYGFDVLDAWGRVQPDPGRWPSSRGGKGFKEVAKKVHDMGLKFGIHVMRGISNQAFDANMPVLDVGRGRIYEESGRQWHAKDIGLSEMKCAWMKHGFMSVNTDLGAGRAFLRSLYTQYAEWGVDFVKLDCVFGDDFDEKQIITVSQLLKELDRPILFSLSPGTNINVNMAKHVSAYVNMYRITADDWDKWGDVETHFDISRNFALSHMIGAIGLHGRSWPDLDMLPLGWLTDSYGNRGPYRKCDLTLDEQRTQLTLWSMARSPLMFGGDLRNTNKATFDLITNPTLLKINSFSTNNMPFSYVTKTQNNQSSAIAPRDRGLIKSHNYHVSHTTCKDPVARGWSIQRQKQISERICWKYDAQRNNETQVCLLKRKALNLLEMNVTNQQHHEKSHLLMPGNSDICLDASAKRKLTASEMKSNSFSPCKWESNQLWELNNDGNLISKYSGLCAVVDAKIEKDYANSADGIRAWIATGRGVYSGEVYLAFFNLSPTSTVLSTTMQDIVQALPSLRNKSCRCTELWTGKRIVIMRGTLWMPIPSHGCALFVLTCR